ncbi:T9SS type A sorting domain-containing protein [Pontibacter sp. CAU 1760]
MRRTLQLLLMLLIVTLSAGVTLAQTIATNLNNATGVQIGVPKEITVTTTAGNSAGTYVLGKFTFTPAMAGNVIVKYQDPQSKEFVNVPVNANGVAQFGPSGGYLLGNDTYNLFIQFNSAQTYNYTLEMIPVAGGNALASVNGSVSVAAFEEPTINGTLDLISGLETGKDILWEIYVTAGERKNEAVNIHMELTDAAKRESITLSYATDTAGLNFQPLPFNENGVAMIGDEDGEPLTSRRYLMKVNFANGGAYAYKLLVRRPDGNILATVSESITVTGTTTGIDDMISGKRIAVYPTISEGLVRVDLGQIRNASVTVIDLLGRKVLEMNQVNGKAEINTQKFAKGTYYVKVSAGNDVATSRLIIK